MKRLLPAVLIISLSSACFAVPLGGKGTDRKESVKGTFEVNGTLSVNGKAILNGQTYSWPKIAAASAGNTILKNDGTGNLSWEKELSAGGAQGALQYNNNGAFAGTAGLVWDETTKMLSIGTTPVSLSGHVHRSSDITQGIFPVTSGGTGTDNGSISGTGDVQISAGADNKNIILNPSGSGYTMINGTSVLSKGPLRSETGFNARGNSGIDTVYEEISDIRMNGSTLQKRYKKITVTGGIITSISGDSDWMDAGSIAIPQAK